MQRLTLSAALTILFFPLFAGQEAIGAPSDRTAVLTGEFDAPSMLDEMREREYQNSLNRRRGRKNQDLRCKRCRKKRSH